jgi:uncharacterized protein (DUF488 family)
MSYDGVVVYTVGHSNVPVEQLLLTLLAAQIELLVDVRQFPMSRRNPQFNHDTLAATLAEHGIDYRHIVELGGRRPVRPDSPNTGLRHPAFRGYADYMATDAFQQALQQLIELAAARRCAIMCAEAVPWRCHRSLISDALVARGVRVVHLIGDKQRPHTLSSYARLNGAQVTYPGLL